MPETKLTQLYDRLTPWERVPLLEAARQREDVTEARRLADSAPRKHWSTADYFGLTRALRELASRHVIAQLQTAVEFWRIAVFADRPLIRVASRKQHQRQSHDARRMVAFVGVWRANALRILGEELSIDMDPLLREWPGYETVREFEQSARVMAFTPDEALAFLRAAPRSKAADESANQEEGLITPAQMAAAMRQFLEEGLQEWS